jgi:glycogen debranching enzyme
MPKLPEKYHETYVPNALVRENTFLGMRPQKAALPRFASSKKLLPVPHWDGHPEAVAAYWKAWQLAFVNLRRPTKGNGFVSNYIDTAFNNCLFMWDSCFILMFGRYGQRAFDFQRTLDNLYAKQHVDGFISRQIREGDGGDSFHRHDLDSTGPNILAWSEWENYLVSGDKARLKKVFPVLAAYHRWLKTYRTWPDGSYWSSGWGCGMDNQPRVEERYTQEWHHGFVTWVDTCLQQLLSARLLEKMGRLLGRQDLAGEFAREHKALETLVNRKLWDAKTSYYYDRRADQSLSKVKSIGSYWALLAGVVPKQRLNAFVAHLDDPREFKRPHRIPTLSADHPEYKNHGGYWLGGVWAPTNYMVLRGLSLAGKDTLAHEIAMNHLDRVLKVFSKTGTLWENYSPERDTPGKPSKADFVGWTGLSPVAILFEYVFGLRPDHGRKRLVWDLRLLEGHGVQAYPFGEKGLLDLRVAARSSQKEKPQVQASSNVRLTLEIRWQGGRELRKL